MIRSMAERAGATITEAEGSHVIMVSQLETVANVILTAAVHRSTVPLPISYEAHPGWSTCLLKITCLASTRRLAGSAPLTCPRRPPRHAREEECRR